jgi:hypothetical protein
MSMSTPTQPSRTKPAPFSHELIEKEIGHLKKRQGVRHTHESRGAGWKFLVFCAMMAGVWFYVMDPFLFSYYRGDAIHDYLYLHNYGSDRKAQELAASGLLTPYEVAQLNRREGSFQDYFNGTGPAEAKAAQLIGYMAQVQALQAGRYDSLSPVNKIRYVLFMKTGLIPPTRWRILNSSIDK